MSVIRYVLVDLVTGGMATGELSGALVDDYVSLRRRIESTPGQVMIALSDSMLLMRDVEGMSPADVVALPAPEDEIVRLPVLSEIDYDYDTQSLVPRPRPSFEDARGKTKAELVADMVARGAPLAWATTTVDALEGEYDAYDPLEGVHPHGTSVEDIFAAAIVAAEARAARRAG